MKERIQKIISNAGICSRRKAEVIIEQGRVSVNGKTVSIGEKAELQTDIIKVDNIIIPKEINYKVFLMNKPAGIICSCKDTHGRKTVIDLMSKKHRKGVYPVGRLDRESRGALLISNNGLLALQLTHPRYEHKKSYNVWVQGKPSLETINTWRNGVEIDNRKTKKCLITILARENSKTLLNIDLMEGRNRQIRKVAYILGHNVIDLKRIAISNIELNNLKEGMYRKLNKEEWLPLLK